MLQHMKVLGHDGMPHGTSLALCCKEVDAFEVDGIDGMVALQRLIADLKFRWF